MSEYHIPVLLQESLDALHILQDGIYVDVTYGAGGHSKPILDRLSAKGHLYAFDQDIDALDNVVPHESFTFIHANYRFIHRFMKLYKVGAVDGILADLGISSHQIDIPHRGFSFRYDSELDMRMNTDADLTAKIVLMQYSEDKLVAVFSDFGEVRNAKTLAKKIIETRRIKKINTTFDLNHILSLVCMGPQAKYFAQVYQALRIEVNDEMGALVEFLNRATTILKPGGRFAVITYHSLEDRLVKNLFKHGNVGGAQIKDQYGNIERPYTLWNKEVITPNDLELRTNPRSRSAKLRVAIKK